MKVILLSIELDGDNMSWIAVLLSCCDADSPSPT